MVSRNFAQSSEETTPPGLAEALVSATPDQFTEIARLPALNSKTWNHPVLVGGVLLIRNGEEMVAFRLRKELP